MMWWCRVFEGGSGAWTVGRPHAKQSPQTVLNSLSPPLCALHREGRRDGVIFDASQVDSCTVHCVWGAEGKKEERRKRCAGVASLLWHRKEGSAA